MRKNLFCALIALSTTVFADPATITPQMPSVKSDCYQVGTPEELYGLAAIFKGDEGFPRDATVKCIELTADIVVNKNVLDANWDLAQDTSSYISWPYISYFVGTIKGNGHSISGLFYKKENSEQNSFGFIGNCGGTIDNLHIKDSYFEAYQSGSSHYVGGLCGINANSYGITIKNSSFSGTIYSPSIPAGGLVGYVRIGSSKFENSHTSGKIRSHYQVGGFVGTTNQYGKITIKNSYNEAEIDQFNYCGYGYAGGFIGELDDTDYSITESYNTGKIIASIAAGGFVGKVNPRSKIYIYNSYNTGEINGSSYAGGIAGQVESGNGAPIYTYNSFTVGNIYRDTVRSPHSFGLNGSSYWGTDSNSFFLKDDYYVDSLASRYTGTVTPMSEFEDGTVLRKLQAFKKDTINGSACSQEIGKDKHPVLNTCGPNPIAKKVLAPRAHLAIMGTRIEIIGMRPGSTFSIFDLDGRTITKGAVQNNSHVIDLPRAGAYIVRVNGSSQLVRIR